MILLGSIFVSFGLIFVALGGWEKIYIFSNLPRSNTMDEVLAYTPTYIWSLTNLTIIFGLILILIGLTIFFIKLKKPLSD